MNENGQTPVVQSPSQRNIILASFACLVALAFFNWYAGPAVKLLDVWWAKLLVYALVPILVTFIILYQGGWHREIVGPTRAGYLLLLSCAILVGVILAIGVLLAFVWLLAITIRVCVGGR